MHERARYFATEAWTGGVIGLGYVGLPLAVTMVRRGLPVVGFDVSAERIERLERGISPIEDVTDDELAEALASGLTLTADPGRLTGADALFLCVPSPLGRHREPDMSYIEAAAATVAAVDPARDAGRPRVDDLPGHHRGTCWYRRRPRGAWSSTRTSSWRSRRNGSTPVPR